MAQRRSKKKTVPSPITQVTKLEQENLKYKFGDVQDSIGKVTNIFPRFAFDFISLNQADLCFNSKLITPLKEYHRLLESLKKISDFNYGQLSRNKQFHFHEVNLDDVTFSQNEVAKCLVKDISKIDIEQLPTLYQFKIFEEARIFGFIAQSIFYLIFFDRNHNAYKRK